MSCADIFCCGGASVQADVEEHIVRPKVVRQDTSQTASEEELPEGAILTGAKKLHKEGLTGKGIKVAVVDSGVDQKHPGFGSQVTKQVWYREGTRLEEDDHGTHVAGTIHLMAPEAEIYDYRVFGSTGKLGVSAAIAQSIREATGAGCKVINMSLGGPLPNPDIKAAVQYAASKGVLLVCAAGNEGDNNPLTNEISYPASYEECISVAAVSKKNGLPVAVFSNSNAQVDYAGIGVDVVSFKPSGGYQKMSGTSMASPHLAGLVTCLLTNNKISPEHMRRKLTNLSFDIETEGTDTATGVGFATYLSEGAVDDLIPNETSAPSPKLASLAVH